jgi:hypothetical protein
VRNKAVAWESEVKGTGVMRKAERIGCPKYV